MWSGCTPPIQRRRINQLLMVLASLSAMLGSVSKHSSLVNHVSNERTLQDTDFCGDPECGCWCDGNSMDVDEQASQNGLQVKCLCWALWSSPITFRPKMLEPRKPITTISSLGLFSSRYYPLLQTVGLDCYYLLNRGTLNIYL
jgi:hypothetical protein